MSLYEVTYNGLTLNELSPFIIHTQTGIAGLPIRVSENLLTGNDGGAVYKTLYGIRNIVLEGTILGDNEEEYFDNRRILLAAFSRDGLLHDLSIRTWDGRTFTIQAFVRDTPQLVDQHYNITYNRFRIELSCPDPYFRDGTSEEFTAVVRSSALGFPLPGPLLMPLGADPAGSTIVIDNTGDVAVVPQFRLDGQIDQATVTNITTGQSFTISTNVLSGRYVLIYRDAGDDYVLLDGVTNFYQFFNGTVFAIVPGNNTIRLTASSADVNALLTISYQNLRNGV